MVVVHWKDKKTGEKGKIEYETNSKNQALREFTYLNPPFPKNDVNKERTQVRLIK